MPFESFLGKIRELYASIDSAFSDAAAYYGFSCEGCLENCCEENFYHYTIAEHLYLAEGMRSAGEEMRQEFFRKAGEVRRLRLRNEAERITARIMCPLNSGGLCALYEYRPMICRLHGIPHRTAQSGQAWKKGPGCRQFDSDPIAGSKPDIGFNHHGFYAGMAAIEIDLRKALHFTGRIKKTVADMVLDPPEGYADGDL